VKEAADKLPGCHENDHKEVIMKKHAIPVLAIIGLAAMMVANPVSAQSGADMNVSIPFDFTVDKTTLPAGQYEVKIGSTGSGVVMLRSADCKRSAMTLTNSTYTAKVKSESGLVFNRYGNQYFLSRVWTAGSDIGRELHKSAAEREINRAYRLARNDAQVQTVAIAADRH